MTTDVPQIATGLIWRVLDDNAVVVSPAGGKVRVLNGVGTVIWQQLVERKNTAEIVNHLMTCYEISEEQASQDLNDFLVELKERGLVV